MLIYKRKKRIYVNIVLFSVLVYELVGPLLTKADDITPPDPNKHRKNRTAPAKI